MVFEPEELFQGRVHLVRFADAELGAHRAQR